MSKCDLDDTCALPFAVVFQIHRGQVQSHMPRSSLSLHPFSGNCLLQEVGPQGTVHQRLPFLDRLDVDSCWFLMRMTLIKKKKISSSQFLHIPLWFLSNYGLLSTSASRTVREFCTARYVVLSLKFTLCLFPFARVQTHTWSRCITSPCCVQKSTS